MPIAWPPPLIQIAIRRGILVSGGNSGSAQISIHPNCIRAAAGNSFNLLPSSPSLPQEKLFNQLLTERVCPLVVKLFSPTSKYRHNSPPPSTYSPTTASMLYADKPTFALSVRLLRILNVLIREFYSCLVS